MELDLIAFYEKYIENVKLLISAFPAFEEDGLKLIEQAKALIKAEFKRRFHLAHKKD